MSDLIERLRAEGKDAFHQKYSLGMFSFRATKPPTASRRYDGAATERG